MHSNSNAIDGRWGWVVVLGSFFVSFIADGTVFSFGFLFIEFIDRFHTGKGETSWIISVRICAMHIFGPIAGMLVNRFGCRRVTTMGALLGTAGLICSVFATNIRQMYFTLGFLPGIGFGMMYLAANVFVIRYFKKHRSLATGISMCGSGVGGFVFNPLTKSLIDEYGWRGTLLIEAGLSLNCLISGAVFRPIEERQPRSKNAKNITELENLMEKRPQDKGHSDTSGKYETANGDVELEIIINDCTGRENDLCNKHSTSEICSSSLQAGSKSSEAKAYSAEADDLGDSTYGKRLFSNIRSALLDVFHLQLLKDFGLLVFLLSSVIINLAYGVPFTYLPDMAIKRGFSREDAVWLVSALTIANTISRILTGIVADRKWFKRFLAYKLAFIAPGIISALLPLFKSYGLMMMYSIIYGAFTGAFVMLWPVVLADLFGVDKIADSFGLSMFASGIGGLFGTPVAGWLFDYTGSYDVTFIAAGAELILTGMVLFLVPVLRKCNVK